MNTRINSYERIYRHFICPDCDWTGDTTIYFDDHYEPGSVYCPVCDHGERVDQP